MNRTTMYWLAAFCIISGVILGVYGLLMVQPPDTWQVPEATMTVNGQFDRVELYDAHYGDWNGQWVVDERVAVIYENGTVQIANTHYEGSYTQDKNFPFLLLAYNGVSRLNETLYVMGNTNSTYEYPSMTVTISLDSYTHYEPPDPAWSAGVALFAGLVPGMIAWMARPNQDRRGY